MDVICSDEDLFTNLSTKEAHAKLYEIMEKVLTPREKTVVTLRYGLGGQTPRTQREIAEHCNISRSYVSRIEKKALQTLQEALSDFAPEA